MASPEELELQQKSRALKLKEESLERLTAQLKKTEERLKANQDKVAKKERANQVKAQDLLKRERKSHDENALLQREREAFEAAKLANAARKPSSMLAVPIVLLVCILVAYFTFHQLEKKQLHYNQIASASDNIDKLASILSLTQDEVLSQSSALEAKRSELERTKGMLLNLKTSTNQLKNEIELLKGDQETSATEKASLVESAETLSQQLNELRIQLEDKYLTIDIIEALVDYQADNLENVKGELATKQELISQQESSLTEQQSKLEQMLREKDDLLDQKQAALLNKQSALDEKQTTLEKTQAKLKQTQQQLSAKQSELDTLVRAHEAIKAQAATNIETKAPSAQ